MGDKLIGVYNPLSTWKQGDLPSNPVVQLVLNQNLGQKDGFSFLSPTLAGDSEVDYVIDSLKAELERAGREAKNILRKQRERMVGTPQK